MKKKIVCLILAVVAVFNLCFFKAYADDDITVTLNGAKIEFDVPPQLIDNRTMVPLRKIFEAMGATVDWNEATQTVTATKGGDKIIAVINSKNVYINGEALELDVPPMVIDDRTLVPVRFVAESFGAYVTWDEPSKTVIIFTEQFIMPTPTPTPMQTSTPTPVPTPTLIPTPAVTPIPTVLPQIMPTLRPANNIPEYDFDTESGITHYLSENYSSLKTNTGTWDFSISVFEPAIRGMEYDYSIWIEYDRYEMMDCENGFDKFSNYSEEDVEETKRQFKDHIRRMAEDLINKLPDKLLEGSYHESHYKYPTIKMDLIINNNFSWSNYDDNELRPSSFRWTPKHDSGDWY